MSFVYYQNGFNKRLHYVDDKWLLASQKLNLKTRKSCLSRKHAFRFVFALRLFYKGGGVFFVRFHFNLRPEETTNI